MPDKPRPILATACLDGFDPEIGTALWRLQDARARTDEVLDGLAARSADMERGQPNSIGSILYHVALIEADWLYTEVLEQPIADDLARLFPLEHRDSHGVLANLEGESLATHRARLAAVRARVLDSLRAIDIVDFHRLRRLPQYDVSPAWVLHHLAQHEAEHRSEIESVVRGGPTP